MLSDTPKMMWSKPPMEIPFPLRHAILTSGHTEMELESVAERLMADHDHWSDAVASLF